MEAALLKEIGEFIGHDQQPTYCIVTKMPSLRSVFYETLRLHPSVPLDAKFAACDTYLEPGHFFIKKGTQHLDESRSTTLQGPRQFRARKKEHRAKRKKKIALSRIAVWPRQRPTNHGPLCGCLHFGHLFNCFAFETTSCLAISNYPWDPRCIR